jgi:heme-degrading monooxygenase HmoA
MAKLITELKVEDFEKWKTAFNSMSSLRKKYGCISEAIYRGSENPNEIVTILLWESHEHAKNWINSPELAAIKAKAGIGGQRNFYFVD